MQSFARKVPSLGLKCFPKRTIALLSPNRLGHIVTSNGSRSPEPCFRHFSDDSDGRRSFSLTDGPKEFMGFSPLRSLRNMLFNILITGYFDPNYSPQSFREGALHAINHVAGCISEGQFDELEDLVQQDVITQLRHRFLTLTESQKKWIAYDPRDVGTYRYEVGVILIGEQRLVEITVNIRGVHGLRSAFEGLSKGDTEQVVSLAKGPWFCCSYRFFRDFTKGKKDAWTINKLNHFSLPVQTSFN